MNLRNIDETPLIKLAEGSHKKILFDCDMCGIPVQQSYRNYLKQNDGKLCRICRNKNTANRPDVKEKQSQYTKERWKNDEYREKTSKSLSIACKKAWENDERKKRLSEKNPMHNDETSSKISMLLSTSENDIIYELKKLNYTYLGKKKKVGNYALKINYICNNGHIRWQSFQDLKNGHRCNICFNSSSIAEKDISDYIKALIPDHAIILNDRNIIKPLELDIVIPEKHIAIEYDGLYWHSQQRGGKDNKYHLNKLQKCNDAGYRLITLFEDEWIFKKEIVKNRLKHILTNEKGLYARKCTISEISSHLAKNFVDLYHIQGYTQCSVRLGAYYNDQLVAIMTFAKGNISKGNKFKENIWELSRFCTSCSVVGIAGKLLKYFEKKYNPTNIYTFADRRWSEGNMYKQIGFNFVGFTPVNYWYIPPNEIIRIHRYNFRKDRIKHLTSKENMTEWDIMKDQGYDKIYDCGNMKFEKSYN